MSTDDHQGLWIESALFQHLPTEECLELLAAKTVGRVGFDGPDGPLILPVNYVLYEGSIFFRTAADSELPNAMRSSRVAFEIDDFDEFLQRGWSVLAVGDAELVDDPEVLEALRGDQGPMPWAAGERTQFVRIGPTRLTGRRVLPR